MASGPEGNHHAGAATGSLGAASRQITATGRKSPRRRDKNIVQQLAAEEKARVLEGREIPDFRPGDTLRVNVRIKEGERERVQAFEGVCIARAGTGVNETFTVRKISFGEGVERKFPILSPNIESIEVKRRGVVRRAKLYYLRDRRGKSARIAERQTVRKEKVVAVPETGTAEKPGDDS